MAWEMRGRSGPYYTRSRRVQGRVVREYIGRGRVAELAAQLDALEREERQLRCRQLALERERLRGFDAALDGLCEATDLLVAAVLVQAGYHRHNRGEWRRRRERR